MTDKLDIIIDKLNRIEANTADAKADSAALKRAIVKALELLDAPFETPSYFSIPDKEECYTLEDSARKARKIGDYLMGKHKNDK